MKKLFNHFNASSINDQKQLQSQLVTLQNQVKQLRIRLGLGQIDKDTFEVTMEHLNNQEMEISKELNSGNVKTSNLEEFISSALKKLAKLSTVWSSSNLDGKRILQKTIFPNGIFYDVKNHQYLTRDVNSFVELVSSISKSCGENKKGNSKNSFENSLPVPGKGKLSNQIIHDFLSIAKM